MFMRLEHSVMSTHHTVIAVRRVNTGSECRLEGDHRQGRVENTFFRYKSIIGDGLRARSPAGQGSEVAWLGSSIG